LRGGRAEGKGRIERKKKVTRNRGFVQRGKLGGRLKRIEGNGESRNGSKKEGRGLGHKEEF